MKPLLTIITPCLNAAATINDTLRSVARAAAWLDQRGEGLEHWILDGGSSDGTLEVVARHVRGHSFCHWRTGVGGGAYAAMNKGLHCAEGHFSHVLNADDFLLKPVRFAEFLLGAREAGDEVVLASIAYFRRPDARIRHTWRVPPLPEDRELWRQRIRKGLHYPHPGFVAASDIYREVGFDCRYHLSADYKTMQTLLLRPDLSRRVAVCVEPLVAMAEGGASGGWEAVWQGRRQLAAINRELGIQAPSWKRYAAKLRRRLVGFGRLHGYDLSGHDQSSAED